MASKHSREFKLVVLGIGGVGKSALTIQFAQRHFVEEYDPTIEDNYRMIVTLDAQDIILDVLDTAGQEEYAAMRDQYMRSGDGFLLCYSITSRVSFEEVSKLYARILRVKEVDWFPVVLVATKADLASLRAVDVDEGIECARRLLGNATFVETSARIRVNVDEAFLALARTVRDFSLANAPNTAAAGGGGRRRRLSKNSDALRNDAASQKSGRFNSGRRSGQGFGGGGQEMPFNPYTGNGGVGPSEDKKKKCIVM
ncbi:ras family-domain-containing protein [Zopfochytrium polystomum]|nr:ras family-domain-containing protein [Zopfochytrium polystomum]